MAIILHASNRNGLPKPILDFKFSVQLGCVGLFSSFFLWRKVTSSGKLQICEGKKLKYVYVFVCTCGYLCTCTHINLIFICTHAPSVTESLAEEKSIHLYVVF